MTALIHNPIAAGNAIEKASQSFEAIEAAEPYAEFFDVFGAFGVLVERFSVLEKYGSSFKLVTASVEYIRRRYNRADNLPGPWAIGIVVPQDRFEWRTCGSKEEMLLEHVQWARAWRTAGLP